MNDCETTRHLSAEQLGDLLDPSRPSMELAAAQAHADTCAQCAAELEGLREALALFRETTTAYASRELSRIGRSTAPRLPVRRPFGPAFVWAAAGLVVLAGALPLELHRRHTPQPPSLAVTTPASSAESDEALLDDVNRDLSSSLPASMQPLADPAGSTSTATNSNSAIRKN